MKFHPKCAIFIKIMTLGINPPPVWKSTARLKTRLKIIRGVAKSQGDFHDATRKVVKSHNIHFSMKITWNMEFSHKVHFCVTGKPKSAKCTKPYEFPPQIAWNSTRNTQNRLLVPNTLFTKRRLWREKCAFAQKGDFGMHFRTFPARGLKTPIRAMFLSFTT